MHVHVNAWLTPLTLQPYNTYDIIVWSCECMFMALEQEKEENPNLAC